MPFIKGMKRPPGAGMQRGYSKKKARLRQTLKEILERLDINLFEDQLRDIADLSPRDRVKARAALMEYAYPKLRSTEVVGMPDANVNVNVANVTAPLQERSQFRQLLENPDTLAAVRLLDSRLDSSQTALVQVDANNKISSLDTNPLDGNGSHLVEGAPPGQQTNDQKIIEIDSLEVDPSEKS